MSRTIRNFCCAALLLSVAGAPAAWTQEAAPAKAAAESAKEAADLLEAKWGVKVVNLRLTAAGYMVDFRYRVLDPVKARPLFLRQIKPKLVKQDTNAELIVQGGPKVGQLRSTYEPEANKVYGIIFSNTNGIVKAGDKITVVIGEFRAENLVVESGQ